MRATTTSLLILLLVFFLAACTPSPPRYERGYDEPKPVSPVKLATEIYFYPLHGQGVDRMGRDRYECHLWAKDQTGFDPSLPRLAPHQRTYVVPEPPIGHDMAAGAFTGAVIGAIAGSPHNVGEGALIGAMAGGAIGAVSDSARQEQARRIETLYQRREAGRYADVDRKARNYRRAIQACLEGRGYSVR